MTAIEALDHLRAQGITLTCTGATVRVSPRHLVTPAVSELIQTYKPDLLTLLTTESDALSPAVERQAQQQGESHVSGASDSHAPTPSSLEAEASRVHSPQCPGTGIVVVSGVGWSCPTCDRRYFVPGAPATAESSEPHALIPIDNILDARMPRPPSLHKIILARLELERLSRLPRPLTARQRRWITGPLDRAWERWQASTAAEAATAVRALWWGWSTTWRRWETVRAARKSGRPEDDPALYALLPRCPEPCRELRCGARTRRGTPCKRLDLYHSSRCALHGGRSTGPTTPEGKARSARNGHCPKRQKHTPWEAKTC